MFIKYLLLVGLCNITSIFDLAMKESTHSRHSGLHENKFM